MIASDQSPGGAGVPHIQFFGTKTESSGGGDAAAGLEVLGGKGINLVELTQARFPVPPGFVITTRAYREVVAANDLQARIIRLATDAGDDPAKLEQASAEIRGLFTDVRIPEAISMEIGSAYGHLEAEGGQNVSVAVRSSATAEDLPEASFAGQQDTYLNICGEGALLNAVKSCWGSLWTARAMSYRAQQKIPNEDVALAVVVQRMVMAEAAGIMFTANPVTGARDEIVINAAWGLGEAIVGGQVTPDTLLVDKDTDEVKESVVSEKTVITAATADGTAEVELSDDRRTERVLDDTRAAQLAEVGRKVEKHYGSPQDVEWCLCEGSFYLVQARPITSLPAEPITSKDIVNVRQEEIDRVKATAEKLGRPARWAIHNLDETLKHPTPMTWEVMSRAMGGSGGFTQMYRDMGYFPSQRVRREGVLDLIGGRVYADLERQAELFYDKWPQEYDLEGADDAT
ncbi:MAG: PEP/pyruvate-binding domain-containing protein, partial [Planctomycetota bacterium]